MLDKVQKINVLNGITLEAAANDTQADANRVIVDTQNCRKLNLVAKYTTGAGETSNSCTIAVYGYDGQNWTQVGTWANSTGTITYTPSSFVISGASAATAYQAQYDIDISWISIKVTALEAGVATNKGTLTVNCLIQ